MTAPAQVPRHHVLLSPSLPKITDCGLERNQRFFLEYPLLTIQSFTDLCKKVYFPTEEYSISVWIMVHCGLFYLFWHCDKALYAELGMTSKDMEACRQQCASNAESAVQRLRICMEPTLENAEALILAVRYSQKMLRYIADMV